jgi:thiol-disulfide isomerase/thioredoxin
MMLMKKLFLLMLAIVPLFCCGAFLLPVSTARAQQQMQGSEEDEISINLKATDGRMYDLAKMRGNVVIVSFGATWCQPCAEELRALEQLRKEYEGKPVRFLWVSVEREDEVSDGDLRSFAKRLKLSFPVLRDPTRFTFAQFSDRVRLPLVTIFNKEGRLVVKQTGMSTPEQYKTMIRSRVDKFLASTSSASSRGTN